MNTPMLSTLALAALVLAPWSIRAQDRPGAGPVVAVGGGGTPDAVVAESLRLARRRAEAPIVAVVPFASGREDRGVGSVEMWSDAGAAEVVLVAEDETAAATIERADVVWMGGGSQDRLLDALERLDLVGAIRARHRAGAVVGGTSAGAAVLGKLSIAGRPDPAAYVHGGMEGRPALDLVPDTIVDQHFRERTREGRLLTAVLDAGGLLGLGVSEGTAAIVEGDAMRVMGRGVVVSFDARGATIDDVEPDALRSASGVLTSVHAAGTEHSLTPPGDK